MQFREILKTLATARVEFVVIGGVGAVLQGAPLVTRDLDVVHERSLDNRRRLVRVLNELDACYRETLPQRFVPNVDDLASPLHHLLTTRFGDLDLLGTVSGFDHDDLVVHAVTLDLERDVRVRVLTLKRIIDLKEMTGREKDLAQLPVLRRTLEEHRKRDQ